MTAVVASDHFFVAQSLYDWSGMGGNGISTTPRGRPPALTGARAAEVVARYLSGDRLIWLEREYGVSRYAIKTALARAGVPVRPKYEMHRRLHCDHHYFDTVDTEAEAYWLGFLAADGCVTKGKGSDVVCVSLAPRDSAHVERLRAALRAEHPVRRYPPRAGYAGATGAASFEISSPELTRALISHGVVPRKTTHLRWPPALPRYLVQHYLRGFIDGDGSWIIPSAARPHEFQLVLVGPVTFLRRCERALRPVGGCRPVSAFASQTTPRLVYSGHHNIRRLAEWLYADATVWLPRKREKVTTALENHVDRRTRGPDGRYTVHVP